MKHPKPSVLILDGTSMYRDIDDKAVSVASLVVCTHPTRRDLFAVLKARNLPSGMRPSQVIGNITRKTLDRLISVNLP